ncbi:chromosome partitioning protein ParB [Sporosarcina sp. P21c]|uniref:ParB/RepB/Spo0J family partition protein n=1 Tax=Sporosarcina TaxID=1569 RepID=UPI000A16A35F|nr:MULTISPECIES: ParB/RepB/Spo0J family partition protein [Sporosarcina]ARJ39051.1 chromosome partitioning protein ParB [Sporosarcina ureae]PIC66421.1 chromosome partitioning protein ParB [Sporosarcina sp. P16a]PIC83943.1 chromosome partitioning protein ParB [Sporosarcina sp. P1]PIC90328.1 chromosome partitioning protein ParB [Sporosarcina sp. P21c]PIC93856.1 chromosome partitioning protein ParB [Sporosarcina sp. P25]
MSKGLGKGLNALFPRETLEKVELLRLKSIKVNPYQPRKEFNDVSLNELSESIKEHGVLQPIIVRSVGTQYEIVVGERRFRASELAGKKEIPAVVRDLTDEQSMEMAILENLQREDLSPIEVAEAYQNLMESLKLTQEQLAFRLGKSRPHIANHIRLLALPEKVLKDISHGILSMGHGRTLLGLRKKEQILAIAEKTKTEGLNVRQLEKLVQHLNEDVPRETKKEKKKDIFIEAQENTLREQFGTNVTIKKTKKKGKIEIEFHSDEDFERILELLNAE